MLLALRTFMPGWVYGAIEFFLTVMTMDIVAPAYGERKLAAFFEEELTVRH